MSLRLGINTGFAVNRFPTPTQWLEVIGKELGLEYVQLTADLINPDLGKGIISKLTNEVNREKKAYNITIDSVMTGAFTRVNHFSHPDPLVRKHWEKWFRKLVDISATLEATNLSSHFGIQSYEDYLNPVQREKRLAKTVQQWKKLAEYAKGKGLEYLSWEPMSVGREYGHTIAEVQKIDTLLKDSAIPIYVCLDIDHGDATSGNPDDTNYKKYLEKFAAISPLIHLKQSVHGKSGNFPFTSEHNQNGKIVGKEFIETLHRANPMPNTLLLLELSVKERDPGDRMLVSQLKESANYWKSVLINN